MKLKRRLLTLIYALCGALCALPSVIPSLWLLGWLAPVPVLYCEFVREAEPKRTFLRAWKRGMSFFYAYGLVTFYWFIELYPLDFAGLTRPAALAVVLVAWLGLPLLQSVVSSVMFIPLAFLRRCRAPLALMPLTAASLWAVFEWLQAQTWAGVPWGKLALGQAGVPENIQSASLLGSYFVGFIMIFVAAVIAAAIILFMNKKIRRAVCVFALAVIIFQANNIFGIISVYIKDKNVTESVTVAAIQANIASDEKWSDDAKETFLRHRELALEAADDGADIIIFSETSLPYDINSSESVRSFLDDLAREAQVPVVAGCFWRDADDAFYNALCLATPENGTTRTAGDGTFYAKRRLVPFGEFVPMRPIIMTLIPPLSELSMLSEDVTPGKSAAPIRYGNMSLGSLICFDSIYEILARETVREGANILCISTNDSWFHDSSAVYQHNSHAVLRSVENGRYTVRAANTGISSIITDTGKVIKMLLPLVEGTVSGEVQLKTYTTPYTAVGNIMIPVCALFVLCRVVLGVVGIIRSKNNGHTD